MKRSRISGGCLWELGEGGIIITQSNQSIHRLSDYKVLPILVTKIEMSSFFQKQKLIWVNHTCTRYFLVDFYPVSTQISLEKRIYTRPIWNVLKILSILRSKIDFYTMEMILRSQNWQDYISNGCVLYIIHSCEIFVLTG